MARARKPKHAKSVMIGQQVLVGLEDDMGYDICLLADPRHEVFCREVAVHSNATKAYMQAFPAASYNTARANGCRLFSDLIIQKRITEIQGERLDSLEVTHKKIIQELAKMAFVDERDFYRVDGTVKLIPDMDPDVVSSIDSVKVKVVTTTVDSKEEGVAGTTRTIAVTEIKHGDKLGALKLLMSQRGMLKENVVHQGVLEVNHAGVVGITSDIEKLDAMRARFRDMADGPVTVES